MLFIAFTSVSQETSLKCAQIPATQFYLCENKHDVSSFRFDLPLTSIFLSVQKGGTRLQRGKKNTYFTSSRVQQQPLCKRLYFQNSKDRILCLGN